MKINSDLERIGDQAVNVAQNGLKLLDKPPLRPLVDLPRMADLAEGMTRDALDAFVRRDVVLARSVLSRDDAVDELKDHVFLLLLTYMMADPGTIERALGLILISRNLERIADHATNIAEDVIKWNQPPVLAQPDNVFYGWNQISDWWNGPVIADDWVCSTAEPVTGIRWWGSFPGWKHQYPPYLPNHFHIQFWTDIPVGVEPFSHPGQVLWQIRCENFSHRFVGWDLDPRQPEAPLEACFLFEQDLLEHLAGAVAESLGREDLIPSGPPPAAGVPFQVPPAAITIPAAVPPPSPAREGFPLSARRFTEQQLRQTELPTGLAEERVPLVEHLAVRRSIRSGADGAVYSGLRGDHRAAGAARRRGGHDQHGDDEHVSSARARSARCAPWAGGGGACCGPCGRNPSSSA